MEGGQQVPWVECSRARVENQEHRELLTPQGLKTVQEA